jgi:Bardet-Biedl syndrome 9 protein
VDCLIPGPLKYIPKRDAFVTVTYAGVAECYLYQTLASSQSDIGSGDPSGSFGLRGVRASNVEWSLPLGEPCVDILLGSFSQSAESVHLGGVALPAQANELCFVCEQSLFLVKAETGGIVQQRRLDRSDSCCATVIPVSLSPSPAQSSSLSFSSAPLSLQPALGFVVASRDAALQVFQGFQLVWAARHTASPVCLSVASFGSTQGLIVSIDAVGRLAISFLGTRPPVAAVLSQVRELDFDAVDAEHRQLLQVIRDAQSDCRADVAERLLVKAQLPKTLDAGTATGPIGLLPQSLTVPAALLVPLSSGPHSLDQQVVRASLRLFFSHNAVSAVSGAAEKGVERALHNVTVSLSAPRGVAVAPAQFQLPRVASLRSTPAVQAVSLFATRQGMPACLDLCLSASYANAKGEPQVSALAMRLPLALVVRPRAPSKSAAHKLVLDTDGAPAVSLTELFEDVLFAYTQAGAIESVAEAVGANAVQAMGFQLFASPSSMTANGTTVGNANGLNGNSNLVSVLVSKNAGRYRLQADSFEQLALLTNELALRLAARHNAQQHTELPVSAVVKFHESLPLEEFFAVVHAHLLCRLRLQNFNAQLNDAAHQYRLVEKRLLVRFKDRNPTPLHGLDVVLRESYDRLVRLGDEIDAQLLRLQALNNDIECFARLIADLVAMKFGLSAIDHAALTSYFCPDIRDGTEQVQHTLSVTHTLSLSVNMYIFIFNLYVIFVCLIVCLIVMIVVDRT